MMKVSFERELPAGYIEAKRIDATSVSLGIIFNVIAFVIFLVVVAASFLALVLGGGNTDFSYTDAIVAMGLFIFLMFGYIILHELTHGIAYKALTGEKLTFGIKWSCAYCGVPDIYAYRRTAIISSAAPFVIFSVIFLVLIIVFYYVNMAYYFLFAMLFGMHLGGCAGDIYILILLGTKFKSPDTLIRDIGPTQFFYIRSQNTQ